MDQEETLRALDDLVRSGKVRYVGTTTHPAWLVMEGSRSASVGHLTRYVSEQPPYNLLDRRIENESYLSARPLPSGAHPLVTPGRRHLAGRYPPDAEYPARQPGGGRQLHGRSSQFEGPAGGRGIGGTGAPGWSDAGAIGAALGSAPTRGDITHRRTAHADQFAENLAVLDKAPLEPDLLAAIDAICPPGTALSNFHNNSGWMNMRVG